MTIPKVTPPADPRTCCIVGAGPAGVILSLLLARKGVPVTLLEAHQDLDRQFRGDTVHPSTIELLDQLGLADRLHELPHRKMSRLAVATTTGVETLIDLKRLNSKYPYIMVMPQAEFLQFLVDEAARCPTFELRLGANVQDVLRDASGRVTGVQYQLAGGELQDVTGQLVVAADGRFSRLRKLADCTLQTMAPPMDVLWFMMPRHASDPVDELAGALHIRGGQFAVVLDRPNNEWQVGFAILKGSFGEVKAQGIEALRERIVRLIPVFAERVSSLESFRDVAVLSVEVARVSRWHQPGLLLIGDAAHVMSPVGGIGIQYAIQDAVAAANHLTQPLLAGQVTTAHLAAIQQQREPAIRDAQRFQTFVQDRIVKQALDAGHPFHLPWPVRMLQKVPLLRRIPAGIIGHGFHQVHWQG